jgi:thioredoxin-dependent peroxiredoxin
VTIPAVGDLAPDFTLDTDAGTPLTLSDLRGRPVVLFFYPKDDTSGCTTESCEFRDLLPRFDGVDAQILGISPDPVKSHVKFRDKYRLNYPLLADVDKVASNAYGVWQQKSMYGRKYMGVARTTFVIGRDGRITHVCEKVKPAGHAAEVAEALASL